MRDNNLLEDKRKRRDYPSIIRISYLSSKLGINIIRDIEINRSFQVLQTDFTEFNLSFGKIYVIVYLCNYSRFVLNHYVSDGPTADAAIKCLTPVLKYLDKETYIHQDQGSAYTSNSYTELLIKNDLYISFSRVGTPSDNAELESFFSRLKDEWLSELILARNKRDFEKTLKEAITYYNYRRTHSSLNKTPFQQLKIGTSKAKSV